MEAGNLTHRPFHARVPTSARTWTILALLLAAGALLVAAPAAADPPANASTDEDVRGQAAAASLHGNATCSGVKPVTLIFSPEASCLALSGTGDARGDLAASLEGSARSCNNLLCAAASGTGPASGTYAASLLGDAYGGLAGASATGNASGFAALTATGDASGVTAASADGEASSCDSLLCAAISGTGPAEGWIAASLMGHASGEDLAASGAGDASSSELVAASLLGKAAGDDLALSAAGDATSPDGAAASLLGQAVGEEAAASLAGDATARGGPAASGAGDATSSELAVSATGDAEGDIAASGTGDADARFLAISGTGDATQECDVHPSITVVGDEGLTGFAVTNPVTGEEVPRPGSGVVAGSGTADDPYVIAGWCIRDADTGIRLVNTTAHVVIRDNSLRDLGTGIRTIQAENVTIRENAIRNVTAGARLTGGDGPDVLGNRLVGHENLGIAVEDAPGTLVASNDLLAEWTAGTPPGIQLDGADDATVRENVLVDHGPAVSVLGSAGVSVVDNQLVDNAGDGIAFASATDLVIRGNNVTDNDAGIFSSPTTGDVDGPSRAVLVEDNRIVGNEDDGLHGAQVEDLEILGNEVLRNGDHGISLSQGVDGALIAENTIRESGWGWDHGVRLHQVNDTTVRDNLVAENHVGVRNLGASNVSIHHNDVVDNLGVGVGMNRFNTHVSIHHNDILRNGNSFWSYWEGGATVTGAHDIAFYENEVRDNTWYGVETHLNPNATIRDNTIVDNGYVGVIARDGARKPAIEDNTLAGQSVDVLLSRTRNATLSGNTMERGLFLSGSNESHYDHDVDATNTVRGDPLRYVTDDDVTVDGPAGQVVVADADEVTVTGQSLGNVTAGVQLHGTRNATVTDVAVDDTDLGVYVERSQGLTVTSSSVSDAGAAVGLVDSNDTTLSDVGIRDATLGLVDVLGVNNTLQGSTLNGTLVGTLIAGTENATVASTDVPSAGLAVFSFGDTNTTLRDNALSSRYLDNLAYFPTNLTMDGNAMEEGIILLGNYNHTIPTTNTVEGEPLLYRYEAQDVTYEGSYGQILLPHASNVTLRDATVDGAIADLYVDEAQGVAVENTTLSGGFYGLFADEVEDLVLSNATIEDNVVAGYVDDSPGMTVNASLVHNNSAGLLLWDDPGASLTETNLSGNGFGAAVLFSDDVHLANNTVGDHYLGVLLYGSDTAQIQDNAFEANDVGLYLSTDDTTVASNTFQDGVTDAWLVYAESLTLEENAMDRGLLVLGYGEDDYDHDIDESNTVDGDPVRYIHAEPGASVPQPAGQVIVSHSDHVTVSGGSWSDVAIPVQVHYSQDARVEDVAATDTWIGTLLVDADGSTATDNHLQGGTYGLLAFGDGPAIEGNTLTGNDVGISVGSSGGTVQGNTLDNDLDLLLSFSDGVTVDGNAMESGLRLIGWYKEDFNHTIPPTNTVQGDPVRYLFDEDGATVPRPAGQVILAHSDDVTVEGGSWSGVDAPVQAYRARNLTVRDVSASQAGSGLFLLDVAEVTVSNVTVTDSDEGLLGYDVYDSRITGSTFAENGDGLVVWDSVGNRYDNNTAHRNDGDGFEIDGDWRTNRILDNNLTENSRGLELIAFDAGEEVHGNNIEGNDVGLYDWAWGSGPDARDNWWGCSDGPDADACDDVRGNDVTYDPWLTSPNPVAGDR